VAIATTGERKGPTPQYQSDWAELFSQIASVMSALAKGCEWLNLGPGRPVLRSTLLVLQVRCRLKACEEQKERQADRRAGNQGLPSWLCTPSLC
jgi:hypothetical protein